MSRRCYAFAAAVFISTAALSLSAQTAATRRPATPATRATAASSTAAAAASASEPWSNLHWRNIGPEGNRFSAAAGIPSDPLTYYVGAASGGVWKTTDGGTNWRSLFDDQIVQSIGSIAVARSDKNVVWVGTGEGKIRSHISVGQGVYKSTDAGETWQLMGLEKTARIPRIVVHPQDPNTVLACALGHAYGPQQERGVYRTTDGGATWTRVLFVDENTGCSDIAMDPSNPRVIFAGMWQLEIHTYGRTSGGPGSGLFVSRDGGSTMNRTLRDIDRAGRGYSFEALRVRALFAHGVVTKRRPARLGLERRDVMGYRPNLMGWQLPSVDMSEAIGIPLSTFAKALKERFT